jgi:hypothetical protein
MFWKEQRLEKSAMEPKCALVVFCLDTRQQQNSSTTTTTKHTRHHGRRSRILDHVPYSYWRFRPLSRHWRQQFNEAEARKEMGARIGGCGSNVFDFVRISPFRSNTDDLSTKATLSRAYYSCLAVYLSTFLPSFIAKTKE